MPLGSRHFPTTRPDIAGILTDQDARGSRPPRALPPNESRGRPGHHGNLQIAMHPRTFVRATVRGCRARAVGARAVGALGFALRALSTWVLVGGALVACGHETLDLYTSDSTTTQTGGEPGTSSPEPVDDAEDTPSSGPGGATSTPEPPQQEEAPCCDASRLVCQPGAPYCLYCAGADGCPPGLACDPLTNQCLAACTTHWMCPDYAPLCDDARGICVHCFGDLHCPPEHSCVQGFCLWCSGACR